MTKAKKDEKCCNLSTRVKQKKQIVLGRLYKSEYSKSQDDEKTEGGEQGRFNAWSASFHRLNPTIHQTKVT